MSQGFVNPYTYATSAPTVTKLTSGSGTYTTPAGVKFLVVELVGGGGGGGGSTSANNGGTGGTGGTTTFGTSLLTCTGGAGGTGTTQGIGGAGGTATLNSPAVGIAFDGARGSPAQEGQGVLTNYLFMGGDGAQSFFGGAGPGYVNANGVGYSAATNTGSGGGGAGSGLGGIAGKGGGAGAYIQAIISSPSASYSYSVGAAGTAGTAGTSGSAGGAGAAGIIIIYEYYEVLGIPTTLTLPLSVSNGGTGTSSATAYAVLCGGTTSTGAHQSIASVGTSGQVLTSNGAGALPTFQTIITDWVAYTPTFTGLGTVTNIQIWSRRVGDTLHIRGRFQAGTVSATEVQMTLGYNGSNSNVTSSSTKITDIQLAGGVVYGGTGATFSNTLIEANKGYITFGYQSAGNVGLTKLSGTFYASNGIFSIMAEVPIASFP